MKDQQLGEYSIRLFREKEVIVLSKLHNFTFTPPPLLRPHNITYDDTFPYENEEAFVSSFN